MTLLFTLVTILIYFLSNKCAMSCEEKLHNQYAALRKTLLLFVYCKPQRQHKENIWKKLANQQSRRLFQVYYPLLLRFEHDLLKTISGKQQNSGFQHC